MQYNLLLPVCKLKGIVDIILRNPIFNDLSDSQLYPKTLNNVKVAFL